MTGTEHPAGAAVVGTDADDLIVELRQLAGPDPVGVRQVVAEVLAALDRAAGGTLRDQLPEAIRRDVANAVPGVASAVSTGGTGDDAVPVVCCGAETGSDVSVNAPE